LHAGIAELLLKKGVITQEEYQQLKEEVAASAPVAAAPAPAAPMPAPATPSVSFAKGFATTSVDSSYVVQVGTLMQFDVAGYNDEGTIDNNAGSNTRRGRLYMQGTVLKDWQYKMEIELFGTTGTEVTDAYLRYNGFTPFSSTKPLAVTAGHFKIPFSFEQLMADKDLSLMERSLPNALLKSRAPGVMVSTSSEHWTASAMGFGEQLYSNAPSSTAGTGTTNSQQDEGGGASARVTWAPIIDDGELLHFGLSAQFLKPTQTPTGETISFSSRPESFTTNLRTLNSGTIRGDVKNAKLFGAEASGVFGPATLTAEYIRAQVDRDLTGRTGGDLTFAGWYAQASWMLSGEHRAYDADKGIFKGIVPLQPVGTGGTGAWELTARYSVLDLNDRTISGGREHNTTLGLGWYANNFVRLSGNWVHVYEIEGGPFNGQSMDALQARLQFAY
jgi:phosphate-selective porin OprO/OprP